MIHADAKNLEDQTAKFQKLFDEIRGVNLPQIKDQIDDINKKIIDLSSRTNESLE